MSKYSKIFFTLPSFSIMIYITAKMGLSGWICLFSAWGFMDFVGMLHDSIKKAIREFKIS
jgi:hypothetical protein